MSWLDRLTNVVRGRDLNPEIDEELRFHLDSAIDDNVAAGMTEEEARRDALRRFGSRAGLLERTRDANLVIGLERFLQDLRHGARVFARNPSLTLISVVSIAFGTGANVAIFSMTDALLLRPLPVQRPGEILTVGSKVLHGVIPQNYASYREYLDICERTKSFDGLVAYSYEVVAIAPRAGDTPRVRFGTLVSNNFFDVLGVAPQVGRGFLPEEDGKAGRGAVVVLSDALWRGEFGADPSVAGRTMRVAGRDFTIVGVAPASYTGLHPYIRDNIFLPMGMLPHIVELRRPDVLEARDVRTLIVKGRLRHGVGVAEAQAELRTIGLDLERAFPDTNTGVKLIAQTEFDYKYETRPLDSALLLVLTILSVAVLAVACANVAGLLASRGPVRAREMALRLAIGASRARLVRQLLTESLAIAFAGGIGGLAVARVGVALLHQIQFPTDLITAPVFELNQRTLAFNIAIAMASAVLVGLGPALQTTRVDLATTLKSTDTRRPRFRVTGRSVLVGLQVALSLVLLTLSVFAIQVFDQELTIGPGFRTTRIAKATIAPNQAGYTDAEAARFFTRALEDAAALPGVVSASATSAMPMFHFQFVPVLPEGQRPVRGQAVPPVWANSVDDRFFETMEIGVLAGRVFGPADNEDAPAVAIVNDTLARHHWPGGDPLGKRLQVVEPHGRTVEIVGVVRTHTLGYPGELPQQAIYFPFRQRPYGQMTLLLATGGDSAALVKPLRDVARRIDPDVPVFDAQTMEVFYGARVTAFGTTMVRLVGAMGLMGMLLTMIGLYGLVSYTVNRRTREIGIRIAIGATYTRIVRMVLRQGMAPAWFGVAAGLMLSVVVSRTMDGLVPFGHHVEPETYYIVIPFLIAVTLVAAFLPARRAARVDPTVALRCE
jgi:predicted permease